MRGKGRRVLGSGRWRVEKRGRSGEREGRGGKTEIGEEYN